MKRKPLFDFKKDLWTVIVDILAVNLSYLIAIVLRYSIERRILPEAMEYFDAFWKFAPIYSVIAVVVFLLFRLYNGLWTYVGLADLNRILLGSFTASLLYAIGNWLLIMRMPISYYVVGALTQAVLVTIVRYAYRLIKIERQRTVTKKHQVPRFMLVGADVNSKRILKYIIANEALKPVVVVDDKSRERTVLGFPVVKSAKEALDLYQVDFVLIVDALLSDAKKEELRLLCSERNLDCYDYSIYVGNVYGSLPLTELLKVIRGPVTIKIGDRSFDSAEEALNELKGRYTVTSISGDEMVIDIRPGGKNAEMDEWVKTYKQETGEDVSFF